MEWVSAVGFGMFPLSDSGYTGTFQDQMHILSMVIVLLLSIISLSLIIISGIKSKNCRSYGIFAGIALGMMMIGALSMNIVPKEYFGIVKRFSVFAATGFQAVLGIHLYRMELKYSYYCWLYWSCNDYRCSSSNTNRKITTNAGNMVLCDVQWSNAESRGYGACKNYTVVGIFFC